MENAAPAAPATTLPTRPLAVALLSGGSLLLEIALTRLFSLLFYPPAVFAILSLAVLGIGLGAALATISPRLRRSRLAGPYMALAGLAALALLLWAIFAPAAAGRIPLFTLVVLPYVGIGLALATLFSSAAAASPRLYRADLLGAGLGTLLAVPALNFIGGVNAVLLAALLLALAAAVLRPWVALLPALFAVALLGAGLTTNRLQPPLAALPGDKPIAESLDGGQIVASRWDAFARTDLVDPGDGGPYRLYVDGAAASVMPPARDNDFLWRDIGLFPFATAEPESVFIIGPGGGLDVWFGLQSGAQEITAVEVNGASVDLVREWGEYNGNLYEQPGVRVLVDEGRSVLRRERQQYDLIFLSQLVTLTAERSGYALVENSSFTVEAFADYLDHLTEEGQIALKLYDEPTLSRALATAIAALNQRGLSDVEALQHLFVLLDRSADPPIPLLLVRKQPFTRTEALSLGAVARDVGFSPLFVPGVFARPPLDAVAAGEQSFAEVIAASPTDIRPTSDDRPFFYQFERGLPRSLWPLLGGLAAVVLAGALLLLRRQRGLTPAAVRWAPLYVACLGVGFIALEVALIQQTRLFLGHPTLAVTVVLAVLFIGGGIGSGLAGRRAPDATTTFVSWPTSVVTLLGLLGVAFWPLQGQLFFGVGLTMRVLIVVVSMLPLALFMGMPFPLALRALGHAGDRHVALAWAVNGVMTVAGSVAAVTVALLAGFSSVLLLGAGAYMGATVLAMVLEPVGQDVPALPSGAPESV